MHKNNVLHRKITSNNILFSADGEIKITVDHLVFEKKKSIRRKNRAMHIWVAPEIAKGVLYSKSADVLSYGCFAFELATG